MSAAPSPFEANLELGRNYERAVAAFLRSRGWLILPVYDYSGGDDDDSKAPKLSAFHEQFSVVTPDLLAAKNGRARWVEVKFKTRCDFTRKTNQWETGFSRRLWYHYGHVACESGIDFWVAFVHELEGQVRGAPLSRLEGMSRFYRGGKMGRAGMVFFPWDRLDVLASLDECLALAVEDR